MAKTVSGKRFCRALERRGWKRIKTKSGHRKYEAPDGGRTVVVPFHGNVDLKRGLLDALLEQTGLTIGDV
jgi:predicted RNA binding protein YcfA (HicA-like mRNA interferase family)